MEDLHLLEKNLSALQNKDERLEDWLRMHPPSTDIQIVTHNYDQSDIILTTPEGDQKRYYSIPPSLETERKNIETMDLSAGSITCLIGMGLGYTARAILNDMENGHTLIVIEPNPSILRAALGIFDFTGEISNGNLHILLPEQDAVETCLLKLIGTGIAGNNLKITADPRSVALFPENANWIDRVKNDFYFATAMVSGATRAAKKIFLNEIINLEHTLFSPGIDALKPQLKGKAMMLIGPGPSLDDSFEDIRKIRSRVVAVAFSTCWKALQENGIHPDFVITCDKNRAGNIAFKNPTPIDGVPSLICAACTHPEILDIYCGPKWVVPDPNGIRNLIYPLLEDKAHFYPGFSVANFSFRTATYIQADPIILVGVDLAVGEYTHSTGHPLAKPLANHETIVVEGIGGTQVKSLGPFYSIKRLLEKDRLEFSGVVFNASPYGARIEGTVEQRLCDLAADLKPITVNFDRIHEMGASAKRETYALVADRFRALVQQLEWLSGKCVMAVKAARRLKRSKKNGKKKELLLETNTLAGMVEQAIHEMPSLKRLIGDVLHENRVKGATIAKELDPDNRFGMSLDKTITVLAEVGSKFQELAELLKEKAGRFRSVSEKETEKESIVEGL